ncbi:hypothetical protein GOC13_07410 [Sinorhizobium meliloti]|nr:hypothetical protein [Sinorhizobium meliloti]
MSQMKVVQSLTLLHFATMNTYEAILEEGKEALRLLSGDLILRDNLPELSELLIVLPIVPVVGDTAVSYLEGDLAHGKIRETGDDFLIDFEAFGAVRLRRNQFHVTDVGSVLSIPDLKSLQEVIVVSSADPHFPFGSKATVMNIGEARSIGAPVVLVKNNLGWVWNSSGVGFRVYDETIVDFEFFDEPEVVLTDADLAIEDYAASDVALTESLAEALSPSEATPVSELSDDRVSFFVTGPEGDPIAWGDLPDEVKEKLTEIADGVKQLDGDMLADFLELAGGVGEDSESEESVDEEEVTPGPAFAELVGSILGAAADEAIRVEHYKVIASEAAADQEDHEDFVLQANDLLANDLGLALAKLTLGMNLLGRMGARAVDEKQANQFENVVSILAEARNAVLEASKAQLDITTDISVNRALQAQYLNVARSLN